MSGTKTFTVRQLDRETARVIEACDTYGAVRIRRRDGRTYTLEAEHKRRFLFEAPDTLARLKKEFLHIRLNKKQLELADRLLAGE